MPTAEHKSKRFRVAVVCLALNFCTFWAAMLFTDVSLTEVGTGLALLNTPLYGYIYGETSRPSKENKNEINT